MFQECSIETEIVVGKSNFILKKCLQCFNVARDMSEGHDVSCLDSCVLRKIIYSDI